VGRGDKGRQLLAIDNQGKGELRYRFMLGSAEDVELDKQGRMTIPAHLRQYAKIERDAVVVGMGGRLEIWNEQNWNRYIAKVQAEAPSLASELTDLSI